MDCTFADVTALYIKISNAQYNTILGLNPNLLSVIFERPHTFCTLQSMC